ncbi:MAG: hypothetical protein IK024_10820 [Treponema sp.]|nr:hypothetical protein [Treponema sp.]
MKQKERIDQIIKNKEEQMKFNGNLVHSDNGLIYNVLNNSILSDYLCRKFNEEHGIILKSSIKTIPKLIQESVVQVISSKELKVHCITDDDE